MKDNTKVLKSALPLYLEGDNKKAVLVLHGYNGYAGEMYELARRIHGEGYTVSVPRLPGHGTNGADFRKTNHRDWHSHAVNEYLNLKSRFDSVSVTGLSMGGVLSLLLAEQFSPEKIILLAPAMSVSNRIFYLSPILRIFIRKIKRNWEPRPSDDDDRRFMGKEYWSYFFASNIASLLKLIRKAQKSLGAIECPVYIILSEKDGWISLDSGDLIQKGLNVPFRKVVLKNSPHVIVEGPEKETVFENVCNWLK
ncbi:MAG: alpha/beta fold hydrolase [Spirochaetales bacterium]|nr:alpha/beta fold hydrolase [Spirochaetales bacterium]